ncbi:MAG TPA: hypothetical protein DHW82_01350 [Spirochaetia bacterium]|nr:MAG: hypothetical protein A2Y41_13620 [Spirochaetes bacterium GWB1_36_13]HCL55643.1 hypothetical protein [Spirochaetia bacterium]
MISITLEQATKHFSKIIQDSLKNHEDIHIATNKGTVVILPQEDYESMQETLRLLADKKSLQALLASHLERDKGVIPKNLSIEEVFNDL